MVQTFKGIGNRKQLAIDRQGWWSGADLAWGLGVRQPPYVLAHQGKIGEEWGEEEEKKEGEGGWRRKKDVSPPCPWILDPPLPRPPSFRPPKLLSSSIPATRLKGLTNTYRNRNISSDPATAAYSSKGDMEKLQQRVQTAQYTNNTRVRSNGNKLYIQILEERKKRNQRHSNISPR